MELLFHGAAEQIGRSCIELRTNNSRILLDAGLWITPKGPQFPTEINDIQHIDAILISHAHLDHTGALPLLEHDGINCPVFLNEETKLITKILLKDSFKISRIEHDHIAYNKVNIEKVERLFSNVKFGEKKTLHDFSFTYYPAGHIPGSASILIESEDVKLLYTGDLNTKETELLKGAYTDFKDVDFLIIESTYGDRNHPPREDEERKFMNVVGDTLLRGGKVLIPAFAVGRAQEILLMLAKQEFNVPIYLDGMARQIAEIMVDFPNLVKDGEKLREVIDNVHFIVDDAQRDEILSKPCIIISTSGMVNGGPILHYLKRLHKDEKSSILMTGYQAEGTNGRHLVNEKSAYIDGYLTEVKMDVFKFDFSAHSGMDELHDLILKIKPRKVIVQHGDNYVVKHLADWIKKQGIEAEAAEIDTVIKLTKD